MNILKLLYPVGVGRLPDFLKESANHFVRILVDFLCLVESILLAFQLAVFQRLPPQKFKAFGNVVFVNMNGRVKLSKISCNVRQHFLCPRHFFRLGSQLFFPVQPVVFRFISPHIVKHRFHSIRVAAQLKITEEQLHSVLRRLDACFVLFHFFGITGCLFLAGGTVHHRQSQHQHACNKSHNSRRSAYQKQHAACNKQNNAECQKQEKQSFLVLVLVLQKFRLDFFMYQFRLHRLFAVPVCQHIVDFFFFRHALRIGFRQNLQTFLFFPGKSARCKFALHLFVTGNLLLPGKQLCLFRQPRRESMRQCFSPFFVLGKQTVFLHNALFSVQLPAQFLHVRQLILFGNAARKQGSL